MLATLLPALANVCLSGAVPTRSEAPLPSGRSRINQTELAFCPSPWRVTRSISARLTINADPYGSIKRDLGFSGVISRKSVWTFGDTCERIPEEFGPEV